MSDFKSLMSGVVSKHASNKKKGSIPVGEGGSTSESCADIDKIEASVISSKSSGDGVDNSMSAIDSIAIDRKIPLEYQLDMGGHTKAVSCISIEPAGNRLITGSYDYGIKIYDFGGMDSRHKAFRALDVEDGYPVVSISHSATGDRFIAGTGSCTPTVYDRDGKEIIKFVRGDMYIRDMTHTKGHVMEVTGVCWHPSDKNTIATSSLDGTVRIWDLEGEAAFGKLTSKHVLKIKSKTSAARIGATCVCFSGDGTKVGGGASDGSIQLWTYKKVFSSRADMVFKSTPNTTLKGHADGVVITSVVISKSNTMMASRGTDGKVVLWNLKNVNNHQTTPLRVFSDVTNVYPTANVEFSPDSTILCCGTSGPRDRGNTNAAVGSQVTPSDNSNEGNKCHLVFFDITNADTKPNPNSPSGPLMKISVPNVTSLISVKWQPNTNQIFCSTASGCTRVFYDPRISKKGVLLSATKAPKREKDPTDYAIMGEILNPHALPMYRKENSLKKRALEKRESAAAHVPEKQVNSGPRKDINTSFFFTKYVQDAKKDAGVSDLRSEDPREALLKYESITSKDPMFLGRAYKASQPKTMLAEETFEEEQENFKKRQKASL